MFLTSNLKRVKREGFWARCTSISIPTGFSTSGAPTGRWNHTSAIIRDRVESGCDIAVQITEHLILMARQGHLPDQIMINTHPQRWFNFGPGWIKELVGQRIKNVIKVSLVELLRR